MVILILMKQTILRLWEIIGSLVSGLNQVIRQCHIGMSDVDNYSCEMMELLVS